jgi:hypothetical protein
MEHFPALPLAEARNLIGLIFSRSGLEHAPNALGLCGEYFTELNRIYEYNKARLLPVDVSRLFQNILASTTGKDVSRRRYSDIITALYTASEQVSTQVEDYEVVKNAETGELERIEKESSSSTYLLVGVGVAMLLGLILITKKR